MKNTENLMKRLKRGIVTAKGIDNDFVFITIGDAKRLLKLLEEDKKRDAEGGQDSEQSGST